MPFETSFRACYKPLTIFAVRLWFVFFSNPFWDPFFKLFNHSSMNDWTCLDRFSFFAFVGISFEQCGSDSEFESDESSSIYEYWWSSHINYIHSRILYFVVKFIYFSISKVKVPGGWKTFLNPYNFLLHVNFSLWNLFPCIFLARACISLWQGKILASGSTAEFHFQHTIFIFIKRQQTATEL